MDAATDLAEQAGRIALRWFRMHPGVENKAGEGAFDPVTAADSAVEEFLRDEITRRYPDDQFLGEETGPGGGKGPLRWLVDPIDGTRAFISGNPLWGILIGLEDDDSPLAGVVHIPYLGETFIGDGERASVHRGGESVPIRASKTGSLGEVILCSTSPHMFEPSADRDSFERLRALVRMTRYGSDCHSYCLLAMGHVDLVVECGLQPYDIVALAPIIAGAGGVVTAMDGGPAPAGGFIVAAANAELHATAIAVLAPQ